MPHADKDKLKAYQAAYRLSHREKRRQLCAAWYQRNRASQRVSNRVHGYRRRYGITIADYDRMLAAQGGKCAVCGADKPRGRGVNFHVDHDHASGKVRGLLCHLCNTTVGRMENHAAQWERYGLKLIWESGDRSLAVVA